MVEYYSAVEWKEVPTRMDLESVMLREKPDPEGHTLSDPTHRRSLEESDPQTRSRWWGQGLGERMGSQ